MHVSRFSADLRRMPLVVPISERDAGFGTSHWVAVALPRQTGPIGCCTSVYDANRRQLVGYVALYESPEESEEWRVEVGEGVEHSRGMNRQPRTSAAYWHAGPSMGWGFGAGAL
jgi:hypothetical protein